MANTAIHELGHTIFTENSVDVPLAVLVEVQDAWNKSIGYVSEYSKTNINVITEPLGEEGEDKFPCCEEAREKALRIIDFREKRFTEEANCEDLYWKIHTLALSENRDEKSRRRFETIRYDWQECAESSTDSEIWGWMHDYRDVE